MTPTAPQDLARRLHRADYDWPRAIDKARALGMTIDEFQAAAEQLPKPFKGQPKPRAANNPAARKQALEQLK